MNFIVPLGVLWAVRRAWIPATAVSGSSLSQKRGSNAEGPGCPIMTFVSIWKFSPEPSLLQFVVPY